MQNLVRPVILGAFLVFGFLGTLRPLNQGGGTQQTPWAGQVVTTTTQSELIPCEQGYGDIGRKILSVHNEADGGAITVTVDLRDKEDWPNFTSGLMNMVALAAGSSAYSMTTPAQPGGRFCNITAMSASTSTITVTLRRE